MSFPGVFCQGGIRVSCWAVNVLVSHREKCSVVWNDLQKRWINLWWQDQTGEKQIEASCTVSNMHRQHMNRCAGAGGRATRSTNAREKTNLNKHTCGHVRRRIRRLWPQTLLWQAPQKYSKRSSDERLEDNWWYFCPGASSTIKQISHLLCRWSDGAVLS